MSQAKTKQYKPDLTPKQKQALKFLLTYDNDVTELAYGGAAGGGKSFCGSLFILGGCIRYPGSRWVIGRNKLSTLKISSLKTFLDICKDSGMVEGTDYNYNQQSNIIKFNNGSEVYLVDLKYMPSDPHYDDLGGLEVSGIWVDEAGQVPEQAIRVLSARIRYKLDEFGIKPKMLLTSNPHKGYLYNNFYKPTKDGNIPAYRKFIAALPSDNPHLPKSYIDNLRRLDPVTQKRLLHGEWEYADELSMFDYDAVIEMFEEKIPKRNVKDYYITVDPARLGKDRTVIIVWNDFDIIEIKEMSKTTLDLQKAAIEQLKYKYNIENNRIAVDADGVGGGLVDFLPGSISIVNNSRPIDGENYQNLKTQMYFKLSEAVNAGVIRAYGVSDEQEKRLTQELQILKREKIDSDGKLQMTSKEQIKQLIGRSNDYSDAMAFRMYFDLDSNDWDYDFFSVNV